MPFIDCTIMTIQKILSILIFCNGLSITVSTLQFPKCEDIIKLVDGKPTCELCNTDRVSEKCSDHCKKMGCKNAIESECNDVEPCVSLEQAGAVFRKCCESNEVKESCWEFCRYDVKRKELQEAVLGGKCPVEGFRQYLSCAANNKNNTHCCKVKHVLDGDREVCEPFCNPDSDDWPTKADGKYLRCENQFDAITKCHWASARLP